MWTLVNKNLLIPSINVYDNIRDFLSDFIELTWQRSNAFNNNVYGVQDNTIYIIENDVVYSNINNSKTRVANIKYNTVNNFNYPYISFDEPCNETYNETCNESCGTFDETCGELCSEDEDKDKKLMQDKLDTLILQAQEEYNKQLTEMRRIEQELYAINKKQEKDKEEEIEKQMRNIIVFYSDCKTWSKLNNVVINDPKFVIPSNFEAKYLFIDELNNTNNELVKQTLELDEDKLYTDPIDNIPQFIIDYSVKYKDISKKLHYKFSHEYEYLEEEV